MNCSRCNQPLKIITDDWRKCWWDDCTNILCVPCYDEHWHCGHKEADELLQELWTALGVIDGIMAVVEKLKESEK